MSLNLLLRHSMPCSVCNGTAELREGVLEQDLGEGVKVVVQTVPVYHCPTCGDESMELQSAAAIERELAPMIAKAPANRSYAIKIHWEKQRVPAHGGAPAQDRFILPEEPELLLAASR